MRQEGKPEPHMIKTFKIGARSTGKIGAPHDAVRTEGVEGALRIGH